VRIMAHTDDPATAPAPVLGAVVLPQLPPERLRTVVWSAEDAGLDELWMWEDCFWTSGIACAATALAGTVRLRIGVGILPAPLRNVALTAMEIATLERLFPGRVHIGVGHGVLEWMGQVGARAASPMTLLEEYVRALRALLRGEQVTTDGRYVKLTDVQLDWPPHTPPPVYVGAVGPKTLSLAGAYADGTVLTAATSPEQVTEAIGAVGSGYAEAGRTEPHSTVVYLLAATGPGAGARIAAELKRLGAPDKPAGDLAVAGSAKRIADAVRRWGGAGADKVVLQPTLDEPDPEGFVRFVGREVRPLLS
jgi:alkanesulfonate monooxygenase SsuD/methylene tetrahydromethanopterin reductase-like flavin-dependent oxidoreductase (luciferase family)